MSFPIGAMERKDLCTLLHCRGGGEGLGSSLLVLSVWAECVRTGFAILRGERPWGYFCPLRERRTAHAFGKNTKNMENAKELTKKYGSPVEEIAII